MTVEKFEVSISALLKKEYRLKLEPVSFPNHTIPRFILLDRTRNIHSYFAFCRNKNNMLESSHWNANEMVVGLTKLIQTQHSELDRPLFIVIQNKGSSLKIIEGNRIRERLLEYGSAGLESYLLTDSDSLSDVLIKIKEEL